MFGRIWFRLFSSNSSCFRSLEKDIRRDCLQGSLPKAVTKMRKILGNSVVPSQDCLGTLLHACQVCILCYWLLIISYMFNLFLDCSEQRLPWWDITSHQKSVCSWYVWVCFIFRGVGTWQVLVNFQFMCSNTAIVVGIQWVVQLTHSKVCLGHSIQI